MTSNSSLYMEVIGKGQIRKVVVLLDGMVGSMEDLLMRRIWGEALAPSERHIGGVVSDRRRGEVVMIEELWVELRGGREADSWHC